MPLNDNGPRMEMRALLAVVLSMVVLSAYQYFFAPPAPVPEPVATQQETQGLGQNGPGEPATVPAPEELGEGAAETPEQLPTGEVITAESPTELVIDGDRYRVVLTNRGGRISSYVLSGYEDDFGRPLDLVHPGARQTDELMLQLVAPDDAGAAQRANEGLYRVLVDGFPPSGGTVRVDDDPVVVELDWADGTGRAVRKRIEFPPAGYQVGLHVDARLGGAQGWIQIGPGLNPVASRSSQAFLSEGAVLLDEAGDLEHWDTGDLEGPVELQGSYRWVALESHYFIGALLVEGQVDVRLSAETVAPPPSATTEGGADAEQEETEDIELVKLQVGLPTGGLDAPLLLAPKRYSLLSAENHELQRVVDFGWFGIIARPLLFMLTWINTFVGNYGFSIIVLTVLLRIVFLPLNHKAMISMRRTQQLQPQMAAIRNKYKGVKDLEQRQKMNEEVMELYRKEGVSPLGGCLPMLAQLPILFAFYRLLSVAIELRGAPFVLWIDDLAQHDPYYVLPLLMGASMLFQQRLSPTSGVNPAQARMMKLMPIIFTVLFLSVPSGLVLYWTTNNILGIAQQLYVNRTLEQPAQPKGKAKKGQRGKRGK